MLLKQQISCPNIEHPWLKQHPICGKFVLNKITQFPFYNPSFVGKCACPPFHHSTQNPIHAHNLHSAIKFKFRPQMSISDNKMSKRMHLNDAADPTLFNRPNGSVVVWIRCLVFLQFSPPFFCLHLPIFCNCKQIIGGSCVSFPSRKFHYSQIQIGGRPRDLYCVHTPRILFSFHRGFLPAPSGLGGHYIFIRLVHLRKKKSERERSENKICQTRIVMRRCTQYDITYNNRKTLNKIASFGLPVKLN